MNCLSAPFKHLYDSYLDNCFFGVLDRWYLRDENIDERNECVSTGFAVNKDWNVLTRTYALNSFHYKVFDHIRCIEEVLSGIYKTENDEFNHILPVFIREYMMGNIWLLHSPEFKEYELTLAAKLAEENQQDPFERLEKSCPDSNFRLLRRVPAQEGGWRWDAVLSGVQDIKIEEFLPVIDGNPKHPIRCTFNEGQFFIRLFEIFATYESQMQTYKALFSALHKVGDINGEDLRSINNKKKQFEVPGVFTHTAMDRADSVTTIESLQLIQYMKSLTESYDNIHALLNDSLGRLGLAGDDSTKAERITTGENFRALQPNMSFQQAIQNRLAVITDRIKIYFQQDVEFTNTLQPNEQGIPIPGEEGDIPKESKGSKENKEKEW